MGNISLSWVLVGFFEKSSVNFGITSMESGKFFSKIALHPFCFSNAKNSLLQGINKVQVTTSN
jgi:hypothetical protein